MHAKMSPQDLYRRFFSMGRLAAEQEARRVCREPAPDRAALLAVLEGQVVGCGSYGLADDGSRSAEIAMAVAERERSAGVASLRHVLSPASVAVIGASRRPRSVGRVILQNIITGGFPGPVYAVNPGAAELDGIASVPSAAALPEPADLAVIAAPPAAVLSIAGDCGRRGSRPWW